MTNKVAIDFVLTNCELPTEVREKLENMRASLEKKSANRKSTKTQAENVGIKTEILKALESSTGMTVSQIMPLVGEGAYTNQKISSLLRQLVESGEVVRYTEKRVAYFRLA